MSAPPIETAFREHRPFLWSLAYRMTGCAADADDVVQETFVRAIERPPADTARPWRPWLTRVALNVGRDQLRKRRRRGYVGPWLPSPVPTGGGDEPPSFDPPDLQPGPAARYDLLESVSIAFLLALEALTPMQRAVLLLRDVLDESVRETAELLDVSEANVKTTHLRARRAMDRYDRSRRPVSAAARLAHGAALQRFLIALSQGDAATVESLLAADARVHTDGGGEFAAARRVVVSRDNVARFFLGLVAKLPPAQRAEPVIVNGWPAVLLRLTPPRPTWAPMIVLQVRLDDAGRIADIWSVQATRKLTAVVSKTS